MKKVVASLLALGFLLVPSANPVKASPPHASVCDHVWRFISTDMQVTGAPLTHYIASNPGTLDNVYVTTARNPNNGHVMYTTMNGSSLVWSGYWSDLGGIIENASFPPRVSVNSSGLLEIRIWTGGWAWFNRNTSSGWTGWVPFSQNYGEYVTWPSYTNFPATPYWFEVRDYFTAPIYRCGRQF